MDSQTLQQVEEQSRQNWAEIRYALLERFPTTSVSDLDACTTVPDLVQTIADKAHVSERFVETRLIAIVNGELRPGQSFKQTAQRAASGVPFGQSSQSQSSPYQPAHAR